MRSTHSNAQKKTAENLSSIKLVNTSKLKKNCIKQLQLHYYYPLVINFLSDFETPLSLSHKLKANFLLESVELTDSIGRYSILASGSREKIIINGNKINYSKNSNELPTGKQNFINKQATIENPLEFIQKHYLKRSVANTIVAVPPFCGGLIGYTGFEAAGYFEKLNTTKDVLQVPDVVMVFPKLAAVYDNVRRMVSLIYLVSSPFFSHTLVEHLQVEAHKKGKTIKQKIIETKNYNNNNTSNNVEKQVLLKQCEKSFDVCFDYLKKVKASLEKKSAKLPRVSKTKIAEAASSWKNKKSNHSKKQYMQMVERGKKYICAGDVFQVVLSQRFSFPCTFPAFEIYRSLRRLNPSPYMFYLNFEDLTLVGSSPETMASLTGDEISVLPIAGTIARGKTPEEDDVLAKELLENEKERAEHLMLIDLGRNDLGRVAKPGSVEVKRYMDIEKYSHVQHIVSKVAAQRKKNVNAIDLMRATFPAGTLSGAPKVRAMEIIAELEKEKRGPYGGMVFYWSLNGNFDSCITIRTLLLKNGMGYVQAGAGVVYDSNPEEEYEECIKKSQAVFRAIIEASERCSEIF